MASVWSFNASAGSSDSNRNKKAQPGNSSAISWIDQSSDSIPAGGRRTSLGQVPTGSRKRSKGKRSGRVKKRRKKIEKLTTATSRVKL